MSVPSEGEGDYPSEFLDTHRRVKDEPKAAILSNDLVLVAVLPIALVHTLCLTIRRPLLTDSPPPSCTQVLTTVG